MTQLFRSSNNQSTLPTEKRSANGVLAASSKSLKGNSSQFPQRFKNFFRLSSLSNSSNAGGDGTATTKPETKSSFRQSRFLPSLGRHRSTTVVSEGNPLDESMSPTALANPYFAHQGPPALRHHNEGSVPPSPPDTPNATRATGHGGVLGSDDQAAAAGKEELARKLRRVASAPNAQGLFVNGTTNNRPATAEMGKDAISQHETQSDLSLAERPNGNLLPVPGTDGLPPPGLPRHALAFRRTYSSNSIKVRNVEVGPSSFDKIKLIGKGDVGKVYLVQEKKSSRLYAMKGTKWWWNTWLQLEMLMMR